MNSKQRRTARRSVERGFGPRHAFNAQEGSELVPGELPTPPAVPETRGGKMIGELLRQAREGIGMSPEQVAEIRRNPLGLKALSSYAQAAIMLMPEHGGSGGGRGAMPHQVWENLKPVSPKEYGKYGEQNIPGLGTHGEVRRDEAGNYYQQMGTHHVVDPETGESVLHVITDPVLAPGEAVPRYEGPAGNKFAEDVSDALIHPKEEGSSQEFEPLTPEQENLNKLIQNDEPPKPIEAQPYSQATWQKYQQDLKAAGYPYEEPPGGALDEKPPPEKTDYPLDIAGNPKGPTTEDFPNLTQKEIEGPQKPENKKKFEDLKKKFGEAMNEKFGSPGEPKDEADLWKEWMDSPPGTEIPPELESKYTPPEMGDTLELPPKGITPAEQDALNALKQYQRWGVERPREQDLTPEGHPEREFLRDIDRQFDPHRVDRPWEDPDISGRWQWRPPEGMRKGKAMVRHNPKTKTGRPRKIGAAPGFGPRHAENAKEGEAVDLTQIPTDTVDAKLTPREAVLNRNAAELAGRGNIEQLNQQGNELARKGVDLAAKGDSDVERVTEEQYRQMQEDEALSQRVLHRPDAKRRIRGPQFDPEPGSPADSSFFRQLYDRMGVLVPEEQLYPDFIKLRQQLSLDPLMAQGGLSDLDPVKLFKRLQELMGGGKKPAVQKFDTESYPRREVNPDPESPQMQSSWRDYMRFKHEQLPAEKPEELETFLERMKKMPLQPEQDRMVIDPGDPLPPSRYVPERPPERLQKGTKEMKPKPKTSSKASESAARAKPKPQQSGSPYAQGFQKLQGGYPDVTTQPAKRAIPPSGYKPLPWGGIGIGNDPIQMPSGGWNPQAGSGRGNFNPSADVGGYYGNRGPWWARPGAATGGGFYGRGQGPFGLQGGVSDITSIGEPPQNEQVYGPTISLSAPQLQQAAQKAGLSPGQIQGLMSAVKGFGQGYNELTGGAGSAADMATAATAGYQGGISEIGYPPMIAPNAQFHTDKVSWLGPYDNDYLIPRYARGSGDVGNFAANPELYREFGVPSGSGFPALRTAITDALGSRAGSGFMGAAGMPWGPTMIGTTYNPQGYPRAVPVGTGPDYNLNPAQARHTAPRRTQ